jgi:hypothetical protein
VSSTLSELMAGPIDFTLRPVVSISSDIITAQSLEVSEALDSVHVLYCIPRIDWERASICG